jgi:hypothetical protein
MRKVVSIKKFMQAIQKLPSDKPKETPGKLYKTQKDHWLGWLNEYGGSGAYGRKGSKNQDAEFAYNHIVEYRMLLWIVQAAGVESKLVKQAKAIVDEEKSMPSNSAAIRKIVPWNVLANALWRSTP